MATDETCYDVLIIGGGVVGLAVLRAATLEGWKCVLVEQEPDLLSCASGSNSGIACTGVDATPGTLERALIRDSISQIRPFLKQCNIPFRPCGSLVCQWTWDQKDDSNDDDGLDTVLAESLDAGDTNACRLDTCELRSLEPNMSASCQGAVHVPGEIVLDPWLYSVALAMHARENGATIFTSFSVAPNDMAWHADEQVWTVPRSPCVTEHVPKLLKARSIVNAAGIQADLVQAASTHDDASPPHWTARPRRGQYRIFRCNSETLIQHPIQPIPTQFTKGVFLFSTLYNQIVVGPTALDQDSRSDCCPDPNVAIELTQHAVRVLPSLQPEQDYVGEYVGIRPGTNLRDYQIRLFPDRHWISAAGVRSTGLTASLGIGRYTVDLLKAILPSPSCPPSHIQLTPLPPVVKLVRDYHNRCDGSVMIHGVLYRVTHPLTRLGWEAQSGIAQDKEQKHRA